MTREKRSEPEASDENDLFEPYEEPRRIPLPVYWIAVALSLWGMVVLYGNQEQVSLGRGERAHEAAQSSLVRSTGATLFEARCATCHQSNGAGLRGAVPPLDGSAFVTAPPKVIVQILLHGIQGPIAVKGALYDGNMPSFASVMSDEDIAKVSTFVRGAWSNREGPVTPAFVSEQRQLTAGLGRSWNGGVEVLATAGAAASSQPPAAVESSGTEMDPALFRIVVQGRGDGPWACASCHGVRGEGSLNIPRLAGLNADYIAKQLGDYLSGARQNEIMQTVASRLSAEEMGALGGYYEGLFAPSTASPSLGGSIALGERLALAGDWARKIPSCLSCHGSSGLGVESEFPALAAQHPAYTASQLNAWVGGARRNSPLGLMNEIAGKLTDADRRGVADYLATLPPRPRATYKIPGG